MNAENLAAVKRYMKIEHDDEDELIWALYQAAKLYLGVREPKEENSLYNLALWRLTLHYYDHRDSVGNEANFPVGLRPIINQLKALDSRPVETDITMM